MSNVIPFEPDTKALELEERPLESIGYVDENATRVVPQQGISLFVLERLAAIDEELARLSGEGEVARTIIKRHQRTIEDHSQRLNKVELDVDELQRRHALAVKLAMSTRDKVDSVLKSLRENAGP